MKLIVGLGNPGGRYSGTKHNAGFEVVNRIARISGIVLDHEKHKAFLGQGFFGGQKLMLAEPVTFMNNSGSSVKELISYYKLIPEEDLIVVSDDIALEPGRIRVRGKGSAGGHNGLKDIIGALGTDGFARIRVGIGGKPEGWDLADWVLSPFKAEEEAVMNEAFEKAASAALSIISDGLEAAMNQFNRPQALEP